MGTKDDVADHEIAHGLDVGFSSRPAAGWFAALAPAQTPPRIVERLQTDFAAVYKMPDVAERLVAMGFDAGA